jgi:exonuclease VII small subunit
VAHGTRRATCKNASQITQSITSNGMKQVFTKFIGKQQYLYIALAIIGMCFAGASLVLAEESETNTTPKPRGAMLQNMPEDKRALFEARKEAIDEKRAAFEAIREERKGMLEEKRAEIQTRIAEKRAALGEAAQERIKMLAGNMQNRFENVVSTLSALIARIENHMEKLDAEGVDTTEAELMLAEAKQKLTEVQALVADLDVEVDYTVTSENPKSDWAAAKEEFRNVHTRIKEVRELLRETVAALKGERNGNTATEAVGE